MVNRFILNETSYFGAGAISVIPDEVKNRGFKKVLVVTDKSLMKFIIIQIAYGSICVALFCFCIVAYIIFLAMSGTVSGIFPIKVLTPF